MIWKRLVGQLDAMGVLSVADGWQIERYAVMFLQWRTCVDFIAKMGMTYPVKSDDPSYYMVRPAEGPAVIGFAEYPQVKMMLRLDLALKQIESNFGLTPSARSRLTTPQAQENNKGIKPLSEFRLA